MIIKNEQEVAKGPDELLDGMEDLMAHSGVSCTYKDVSRNHLWQIIYRGICNPLSSENKLFQNILRMRSIAAQNERNKLEQNEAKKVIEKLMDINQSDKTSNESVKNSPNKKR